MRLVRKAAVPVAVIVSAVLAIPFLAVPLAPEALANTYICLKPTAPVCMQDATTFVSAERMQGCQFEVKEYVERTMAYLQCLNDENTATGRELTRNIERFNCHLSGGSACD